ncbi:hypothetical protein EVAR_45590_1 [Eumeta japonica]|uniref:Uncharacterized protein n=1 Tax=Eumeta variegata TaxID=151549 RepID=A0A4C1YXV9_EUMVA|nr:hypothetical protein EVAR_45590_1 [Eumeta japonica]
MECSRYREKSAIFSSGSYLDEKFAFSPQYHSREQMVQLKWHNRANGNVLPETDSELSGVGGFITREERAPGIILFTNVESGGRRARAWARNMLIWTASGAGSDLILNILLLLYNLRGAPPPQRARAPPMDTQFRRCGT